MREMRATVAAKYFMVERVVVVCERVVRLCRRKEEELKRRVLKDRGGNKT